MKAEVEAAGNVDDERRATARVVADGLEGVPPPTRPEPTGPSADVVELVPELPAGLLEAVGELREERERLGKLTVERATLYLLAVVDRVEDTDDGGAVVWGYAYADVLAAVRLVCPGKGTIHTMRWYGVKAKEMPEDGAEKRFADYEMPDKRPQPPRRKGGGR